MGVALLGLSACEDFLDITPEGQVKRDELLSTPDGIEDAMYGVYAQLRGQNLYGREMSFSALDVMAQYYQPFGNNYKVENLQKYNYTYSSLETLFQSLWTDMYHNISNVNSILESGLVSNATAYPYKIYRGEALGLRAFMHFDLLRLFAGQITVDPEADGIPYATTFSLTAPDFAKAAKVYEYILADLLKAEELLADEAAYAEDRDFMTMRQIHFNIHAVRATLARVYLTMGNYEKAETYARKVIDESGLSLLKKIEVKGDVAGCLSRKETVLGIYSTTEFYSYVYDDLWLRTTHYSLDPRKDYASFYETAEGSDYRLEAYFTTKPTGEVRFTKILDSYKVDNNEARRPEGTIQGINLIRLPEMYYIVAECRNRANDTEAAAALLDKVRESRGIERKLDWEQMTAEMMQEEINAERYKELIGEGQMFYHFKRLNLAITDPNGTSFAPSSEIYVVPIPEIEYDYRN
jgi:hypothetical protein